MLHASFANRLELGFNRANCVAQISRSLNFQLRGNQTVTLHSLRLSISQAAWRTVSKWKPDLL